MALVIYTNGTIHLDGKDTGLGVSQGKYGTEVYTREGAGRKYQQHAMPNKRYALSTDVGAETGGGKKPGRLQFEADVRALLGNGAGA